MAHHILERPVVRVGPYPRRRQVGNFESFGGEPSWRRNARAAMKATRSSGSHRFVQDPMDSGSCTGARIISCQVVIPIAQARSAGGCR
jgi:hypothetical protein